MGLFKMLAYALLGYAIYEFVRGMVEETEAPAAKRNAPSAPRPRQNLAGKPGRGVIPTS